MEVKLSNKGTETLIRKKVKVTFFASLASPALSEAKNASTAQPLHTMVEGEEGESILEIALRHDIPLDHNCGGNCACTTCHVIVKDGMDNLSEIEENEEDMLDKAKGLTLTSRLGCQAHVYGDVVVEIPKK